MEYTKNIIQDNYNGLYIEHKLTIILLGKSAFAGLPFLYSKTNYTYHANGENTTNYVQNQTTIKSDNMVIDTHFYNYDQNNNLTVINRGLPIIYTYGEKGELLREENYLVDKVQSFTYDESGNITSRTIFHPNGQTTVLPYVYDEQGRLIEYNDNGVVYGNNNSPKYYFGWECTWNNGRLSKLSKFNHTVSYEYDCNNYRTQKTYNGGSTYYYYLGDKLLGEMFASRNNTYNVRYLYNGNKKIGFVLDNVIYYYQTDILGNIKGIIDTSGNVVVKYEYDAWGDCVILQDTEVLSYYGKTLGNLNPIRYKGYYYDTETNLYYLINRYYDPKVGRFISSDSSDYLDFSNDYGINLFAYCNNNPVMGYDPTGTDAILITDFTNQKIVGHSFLLIQDKTGVWWRVEFTLDADTGGVLKLKGKGVVIHRKATEDEICVYVKESTKSSSIFNLSGHISTRINGDFDASLSLAQEYASSNTFGDYDFLFNNCQDFTNVVLDAGTAIDEQQEQAIHD